MLHCYVETSTHYIFITRLNMSPSKTTPMSLYSSSADFLTYYDYSSIDKNIYENQFKQSTCHIP